MPSWWHRVGEVAGEGREPARVSSSPRVDRFTYFGRCGDHGSADLVDGLGARALTALLRTTRRTRIAFTAPSLDFRVPGARPERIAVASA